ncbi:MAG: YlxR family protein [Proteobacteria bacterium]|nr:YlxR family protein [Pseudomonadota bacterium]
MAPLRGPLRSCVACRQRRPGRELLRWVVDGGGRPRPDLRRRSRGRGAHCCAQPGCLGRAFARGALGRALKTPLPALEPARVLGELLQALALERLALLRQCLGDGRARWCSGGAGDGAGDSARDGAGGGVKAGAERGLRAADDAGRTLWLADPRAAAQVEQWERWMQALATEPRGAV